jgi:DNA-binding NarL/FixJ family response regulator
MSKSPKTRVVIVDRQPIFRSGLNELLSREGIAVVGEAEDGEGTLKAVDESKPTVVLLDSMLAEAENSTILQDLQQKHKGTKVILLTPSDRDGASGQIGRGKSAGVLPKQASFETLIRCIQKIESGEAWVNTHPPGSRNSSASAPAMSQAREQSPLSLREKQVASLVSQGFRNKEIAERMFISEQTVKNHLHNIFDKLGVSDRLELALYAIHRNLHTLE